MTASSRAGRALIPMARGAAALTAAAVAVAPTYFGILTGAAWWARWRGRGTTPTTDVPRHRFVIVVPAHDEERVIGATLQSFADLDYPTDWYSVHVVADNCTDGTAEVVRGFGFHAHERTAPDAPGKGPALQWLLSRVAAAEVPADAIVVVDADSILNRQFLRVMDAKLAAGDDAVQGYYAVRDPGQSAAVGFRAAALAARHYLRQLGRTELGASSGLHGNGMVFRSSLLAGRPWTTHLTEDIELQLDLLLEGTLVGFAPDAVVEAEMPTTLEGSVTQHQRWERGRIELAQRYVPRLVREVVRPGARRRLAAADAAVDIALPPFSVIVLSTATWSGVRVLVAVATGRHRARSIALAGWLVGLLAAYVASSLHMVEAPPSVYRSLRSAPRMVWWKVRLWSQMVTGRREVGWVRTTRNVEREATPAADMMILGSLLEVAEVP